MPAYIQHHEIEKAPVHVSRLRGTASDVCQGSRAPLEHGENRFHLRMLGLRRRSQAHHHEAGTAALVQRSLAKGHATSPRREHPKSDQCGPSQPARSHAVEAGSPNQSNARWFATRRGRDCIPGSGRRSRRARAVPTLRPVPARKFALGIEHGTLSAHQFLATNFDELVHELHSRCEAKFAPPNAFSRVRAESQIAVWEMVISRHISRRSTANQALSDRSPKRLPRAFRPFPVVILAADPVLAHVGENLARRRQGFRDRPACRDSTGRSGRWRARTGNRFRPRS